MTNKEIEIRLINLENAFIQSQKNASRVAEKAGIANSKVTEIFPYMDSEKAYIGDTSVTFTNVKAGNISAYCESDSGNAIQITSINRQENIVTIGFDELTEVATVTISVL